MIPQSMPVMENWQWALGWLGALFIGLGKGGLPGLGNLTIALYALAFPSRASVGILLLVLICADFVAITIYRRHVHWPSLGKLIPWAVVGMLIGYFALGQIDNDGVRRLIGFILLGMTGVHFYRRHQLAKVRMENSEDTLPHALWFVASMGIIGGFATMTANGAGPVAALYLLAVGLPKMAFIGTTAWFFVAMNLFKVPFHVDLGIITRDSLLLSLSFAPVAAIGVVMARMVVRFINQRIFEALVWFFIVVAGSELLFNISMVFRTQP